MTAAIKARHTAQASDDANAAAGAAGGDKSKAAHGLGALVPDEVLFTVFGFLSFGE